MYSIFIVLWTTLIGSFCGIYYSYYNYGPDPGQIATWMGVVCGWFGMMTGLIYSYLRSKPRNIEYQRVIPV